MDPLGKASEFLNKQLNTNEMDPKQNPHTAATNDPTNASSLPFPDKLGAAKSTNAIPNENPSIFSSAGGIGKQFNPDGAIGQIGEKLGGPFSKEGMIGKQFDASKDGVAGMVERGVDGPRNPAGSSGTK